MNQIRNPESYCPSTSLAAQHALLILVAYATMLGRQSFKLNIENWNPKMSEKRSYTKWNCVPKLIIILPYYHFYIAACAKDIRKYLFWFPPPSNQPIRCLIWYARLILLDVGCQKTYSSFTLTLNHSYLKSCSPVLFSACVLGLKRPSHSLTWKPPWARPRPQRPSSSSTSSARTRWTRWFRCRPGRPRSPYLAALSLWDITRTLIIKIM